MRDVTDFIATFREAARHLWNTCFYPKASWEDRERYGDVLVALFDALVLVPSGITGAQLPRIEDNPPLPTPSLRVVPRTEAPILINRSTQREGYWDDSVNRVQPSDGARLDFVSFFDFDELGRRDFRYLEVHIEEFQRHAHLVGRRALIEFEYIGVFAAEGS